MTKIESLSLQLAECQAAHKEALEALRAHPLFSRPAHLIAAEAAALQVLQAVQARLDEAVTPDDTDLG